MIAASTQKTTQTLVWSDVRLGVELMEAVISFV
jgi:hypothetical protein